MLTSVFQIRSLLAAVALVTLSGLLQPAMAAPGGGCGSVDRLTVALRFAQILYPELKDKELSISLSDGRGPFVSGPAEADDQIRVFTPIWLPPGETTDQYYGAELQAVRSNGIELPLHLFFDFIEKSASVKHREFACRPLEFTSDAGYKQKGKARTVIEAHPKWTDAEELEAARKLGSRCGPQDKAALLRLIPLKEHGQFYGPLRIESTRFSMNGGGKCAGCSFVDPSWEITVSESGDTRRLLIIVEPFFGKITSIAE